MELIIKPTAKCNFNCKFCATSNLKIDHTPKNVPVEIKNVINTIEPDAIIITGGEPLCCDPEYYEELLELTDCNIAFTSNLKDFYLNPDKWINLFKNERISVATSFNYGNTRMWDRDTIYDENMFRRVIELFNEKINYSPSFIAVIDHSNEHLYMEHIYLAKELNTYCRLNNAIKVGKQGIHYQRYNIFKLWIDIINKGFESYEQNCFERSTGKCPMNTSLMCQNSIRSIYIDPQKNIHYSNCEDKLNTNDVKLEFPIEDKKPNQVPNIINYNEAITLECLYCELMNICNACYINRLAAKQDSNYCKEMKKLKNDIIELGWKL